MDAAVLSHQCGGKRSGDMRVGGWVVHCTTSMPRSLSALPKSSRSHVAWSELVRLQKQLEGAALCSIICSARLEPS